MGLLDEVLRARQSIKKGPERATKAKGKASCRKDDGVDSSRTVGDNIVDKDFEACTSPAPSRPHTEPIQNKQAEGQLQSRLPVSFYSSWQTRNVDKAILKLLHHVKEKMRLGAFSPPFQYFPLQEPAFRYADNHDLANDLRIYSVEKNDSGKRGFIVSTVEEFWRRYEEMLPQHRHHYEIIREGSPCKLYFDLEFKPQFNSEVNGEELVDDVIKLASAKFEAKFGTKVADHLWIELDSSTDQKFSRHLILMAPDFCFKSNLHVGAFVEEMIKECLSDSNGPSSKWLVSKDETDAKTLFIDNGVYTKNRAFRLMLSSKAGKLAILTPTGRLRPFHTHRTSFFESLICNVPANAKIVTCFEGDTAPSRRTFGNSSSALTSKTKTFSGSQGEPSPFPAIDDFITSVCQQDEHVGWIRTWAWTEEEKILLLNIGGTRYCGNVGRQHKSNGIYFIADLQDNVWYQKCYDPDCRSYRSEVMPLPAVCLPPKNEQVWPADDIDDMM